MRMEFDLVHHVGHDLVVGLQQVVAAHAGLARDARGDDHDVGVCCFGVVVRADDVHVALLDRHGFEQVERLALGNALRHVDEDYVSKFLGCYPVCGGRAYVSCSNDSYFLAHVSPVCFCYFMFSIIRVANSLVFTLVAPCIWRSKS
jgi:hypothetical protein